MTIIIPNLKEKTQSILQYVSSKKDKKLPSNKLHILPSEKPIISTSIIKRQVFHTLKVDRNKHDIKIISLIIYLFYPVISANMSENLTTTNINSTMNTTMPTPLSKESEIDDDLDKYKQGIQTIIIIMCCIALGMMILKVYTCLKRK